MNLKHFFEKKVDLKKIEIRLFLLWSFTVFFSELNFIFYVFSFTAITRIIVLKKYKRKVLNKENIIFFLILGYVFWNIISLTYSDNFYEGIKRIEKLIPLILISLVGLYTNEREYSLHSIQTFYLYGGLFSVLFGLIYTCYTFYTGNLKAITFNKGIDEINFLFFFEHRLYIGILILMIVPAIYNKIFNSKKSVAVLWLLVLLILLFVIYSTGARLLILLFVIISLILLFKELKNKIKKVIFFPLLASISIILLTLVYTHPRTNLTLHLLKNDKKLDKVDSRFNTWDSAYKLWMENFMLGEGIGDASSKLLEKYKENQNRLEYENQYNAHNQFLETSIQSGLIGLVFLCSILVSLVLESKKNKDTFNFLIIIICSFLVESLLNRNLGTFAFAYWTFVLSVNKTNARTIKINDSIRFPITFIIISFFILFSVFLYSKLLVFNPQKPNTYLTIPFEELEFNNLPKKNQLPKETNAAFIFDKQKFKKFEYGYYLAPEIYSGFAQNTVNVDFGIWCYVSKDSNIRRLYIYGWDKINKEYKLSYDFKQKGSWQYLELQKMEFSGSFATGVRLDLYRETIELKGKVLLALPSFELKK